jgi:hypothetical protein
MKKVGHYLACLKPLLLVFVATVVVVACSSNPTAIDVLGDWQGADDDRSATLEIAREDGVLRAYLDYEGPTATFMGPVAIARVGTIVTLVGEFFDAEFEMVFIVEGDTMTAAQAVEVLGEVWFGQGFTLTRVAD